MMGFSEFCLAVYFSLIEKNMDETLRNFIQLGQELYTFKCIGWQRITCQVNDKEKSSSIMKHVSYSD